MIVRALAILATAVLCLTFPPAAAAQTDADGDGHASVASGGDDCDDGDASRFPGNTEIPDRDNHDEDCDPTTFGFIDQDGDGFGASWACNVDAAGRATCGADCDDRDRAINPNQIDICNNRDDDCDGNRDEDQPCDLIPAFREDPDLTLEGIRREAEARRERRDAVQERAGEALGDEARVDVERPAQQVAVPVQDEKQTAPNACHDAVQGKIAWDYQGSTRWAEGNIERLCEGAENSVAPARCFDRVMHEGVDRGDGSTRWTWQDASNLCASTRDAGATIDCFKSAVSKGRSQAQAIKECAAG